MTKIIATFGFIVGMFNIFMGVSSGPNIAFLVAAFICFVLSFGIFKLWNWARMATFILFVVVVLVNGLLLYGTWLDIMGHQNTWALLGIIANFPLSLWSLVATVILSLPKVKKQFRGQ